MTDLDHTMRDVDLSDLTVEVPPDLDVPVVEVQPETSVPMPRRLARGTTSLAGGDAASVPAAPPAESARARPRATLPPPIPARARTTGMLSLVPAQLPPIPRPRASSASIAVPPPIPQARASSASIALPPIHAGTDSGRVSNDEPMPRSFAASPYARAPRASTRPPLPRRATTQRPVSAPEPMPTVDTAAFTTWLERGDAEIGLEDAVRFDLPESVPVRRIAAVPRWPLALLALLVVGVVVAAIVMAVRARTSDPAAGPLASSSASSAVMPASSASAPAPASVAAPASASSASGTDSAPALDRSSSPAPEQAARAVAVESSAPVATPSSTSPRLHRRAAKRAAGSSTQGKLEMQLTQRYAISVDGKPTGLHTPQRSLPLAIGMHRVTLIDEKGTRRTIEVTIEAGKTTRLHDFASP